MEREDHPAQLSLPIPQDDDDRFASYSTHDNDGADLSSPTSPVSPSIKEAEEKESILPRLALPLALIVGALLIGGGTAGVVIWVQNLVKNASVHKDEAKWKSAARSQVYDACYFGCNDCNDPNFAWDACQTSTKVAVQGVICDANKMWNWAQADRYPEACLAEVGKVLMAESLKKLKSDYRKRFALIVLTVLGGAGIGFLVYFLMRKFFGAKNKFEKASTEAEVDSSHSAEPEKFSLKRPSTWKVNRHKEKRSSTHSGDGGGGHGHKRDRSSDSIHHAAAVPASVAAHEATSSLLNESPAHSPSPLASESRRSSVSSTSSRSSRGSRGSGGSGGSGGGPRLSRVLTAAISIAASASSADAYACAGKDPAHNQHFVSVATMPGSNVPKISGVIHGWFSDCKDKKNCNKKCKTKCKRGIISERSCTQSCSEKCKTVTTTTKSPKMYVDAVVPKLAACGFRTVDAVQHTVATRVGNAKIERDLWVKISVSALNVTTTRETDKEIMCLHGIAG